MLTSSLASNLSAKIQKQYQAKSLQGLGKTRDNGSVDHVLTYNESSEGVT